MTRAWARRDCPLKLQARMKKQRLRKLSCRKCEVDKEWCRRFRQGDLRVSGPVVLGSAASSFFQAWFKSSCRAARKAGRKRAKLR